MKVVTSVCLKKLKAFMKGIVSKMDFQLNYHRDFRQAILASRYQNSPKLTKGPLIL